MVTIAEPRLAWIKSARPFDAPLRPPIPYRRASMSVDLPLPRGPIMQVRPGGSFTESPGKKPPVISIASNTHFATTRSSFFQRPSSVRHAAVRTKESLRPPGKMREIYGRSTDGLTTEILQEVMITLRQGIMSKGSLITLHTPSVC